MSCNTSFLGVPIPTTTSSSSSVPTNHKRLTIISSNQPSNSNSNSNTFLTSITKLLWGQSLPPSLLISTVRYTWSSTWHLMMSQLAPSSPSGSYTRPTSQFPLSTTATTTTTTNLHLYVGLPCPWAHRTLIVRSLKGLEDSIPVSVASPGLDGSWEFKASVDGGNVVVPTVDKVNKCRTLKEVYRLRSGGYNGRSTVPMLWDGGRREVVCNESYDILEFFNSGFNDVASNPGVNLAPASLKKEIDEWNRIIYPNVNNGVYRCGFAQSQEAYDVAVNGLFSTLDMIDDHLSGSRYLCGDVLTLADVCLFTTLIRFDLVYNVLFKCTKKKVIEYGNLYAYLQDIYQIPKVASTCNFEAIREGYYGTLFPLNPGSILPVIPSGCEHDLLSKPHGRESLSSSDRTAKAYVS